LDEFELIIFNQETKNFELIDTNDIQNACKGFRGGLKSKLNILLSTLPWSKYTVASSPGLTIWKFLAEGILARLKDKELNEFTHKNAISSNLCPDYT
jgi:hypothetical protein